MGEKKDYILGISIVVAALIISIGLVFSAMLDRYTFYKSDSGPIFVEDKLTGDISYFYMKNIEYEHYEIK